MAEMNKVISKQRSFSHCGGPRTKASCGSPHNTCVCFPSTVQLTHLVHLCTLKPASTPLETRLVDPIAVLSASPLALRSCLLASQCPSSSLTNMSKNVKEQTDLINAQLRQLRAEANIKRKPISEVAKDLKEYCEKNKEKDALVNGISESNNPWNEKKSCLIL